MRVIREFRVLFLPAFDLFDAAARILIQRNVPFGDELRIGALDPVGLVFGVVFARFGDVVAEFAHHLDADHVAGLVGRGGFAPLPDLLVGQLLELRIEVLAVLLNRQQPGHVVDAGDVGAEVFFALLVTLQAEGGQQAFGADLDRVAETDRLHAAAAEHRAGEHRHRIGVVEEPGIRRDLFDLAGEVEHHRNRPQCTEDAADAERVGDGLAKAVFLGNLEVDDG